MLKTRAGVIALAISSLFGLTTAAAARDHDRDNSRYYSDGYRGMSEHQRHKLEERQEKAARRAEQRLERERRQSGNYNNGYYAPYRNNNGYYGPYNNSGYPGTYRNDPYYDPYAQNANGYYDRYGYWHPYRR